MPASTSMTEAQAESRMVETAAEIRNAVASAGAWQAEPAKSSGGCAWMSDNSQFYTVTQAWILEEVDPSDVPTYFELFETFWTSRGETPDREPTRVDVVSKKFEYGIRYLEIPRTLEIFGSTPCIRER